MIPKFSKTMSKRRSSSSQQSRGGPPKERTPWLILAMGSGALLFVMLAVATIAPPAPLRRRMPDATKGLNIEAHKKLRELIAEETQNRSFEIECERIAANFINVIRSGKFPKGDDHQCTECTGKGKVWTLHGQQPCEVCKGKGVVDHWCQVYSFEHLHKAVLLVEKALVEMPKRMKKLKDSRRKAGLCSRCGGKRDCALLMCVECRKYSSKNKKDNRENKCSGPLSELRELVDVTYANFLRYIHSKILGRHQRWKKRLTKKKWDTWVPNKRERAERQNQLRDLLQDEDLDVPSDYSKERARADQDRAYLVAFKYKLRLPFLTEENFQTFKIPDTDNPYSY